MSGRACLHKFHVIQSWKEFWMSKRAALSTAIVLALVLLIIVVITMGPLIFQPGPRVLAVIPALAAW